MGKILQYIFESTQILGQTGSIQSKRKILKNRDPTLLATLETFDLGWLITTLFRQLQNILSQAQWDLKFKNAYYKFCFP